MTYTRINAESATKKLKAYTHPWTNSITFYMAAGSQAIVLFNQSTMYCVWNNPDQILIGSINGTLSGLSISRTGYPGNVTLSWSGNFKVSVLYIQP